MAQPRCADGAAGDPSRAGRYRQDQYGQRYRQDTAAGGPRPWEATRRDAMPAAVTTGARGRGRLPASPVRVARTLRLLVDEWGWPVVPGAFVESGMCSCGDADCDQPGRHALSDASWLAATSDADRVRDRWRAHPEATIVLPVGWCFDLLEVPERGGREAVGRLNAQGSPLPPVIATATGRLLFLVAALDRNAGAVAEGGSGGLSAPTRRAAVPPRPAGTGSAYDEEAARDAAAAREAAAAGTAVTELEPWPASSTWLASAAGCRPETSIWVGGGALDAPDVVVRRSGLLVAPLLGPEPPGVTRWLVPPATGRSSLPRMEDVLGPIVQACREMAVRPSYGYGSARRPEELPRRLDSGSRRPEAVSSRGGEAVSVRGPEGPQLRTPGVSRLSEAISGREAEVTPARGPEPGLRESGPGGSARAADAVRPGAAARPIWPAQVGDTTRRAGATGPRSEPSGRGPDLARGADPSTRRVPGQGRPGLRPRLSDRYIRSQQELPGGQ